MLRPFSIISDEIEYDTAGASSAEFRFPVTPKGFARCAIVGVRFKVSGVAVFVSVIQGWGSLLERLTVAGRNYVQGEIPFPLIASHLVTGGIPYSFPWANRFLGSAILLPGQMLGQGVMGAAIAYGPSDEIRMRVRRLQNEAFVDRVILDCVQWPDDAKDPSVATWNALRYSGLGEAYFIGRQTVGYAASGTQLVFDELPQPPSARALRRTGFRGVITDLNGSTQVGGLGFEEGAPAEATLNNVSVEVSTSFQRPPQNDFIPFRGLIGLIGGEIVTGLVDMAQAERSILRLNFTGTNPGDPEKLIYTMHMFEGRDEAAPTLQAATAIS